MWSVAFSNIFVDPDARAMSNKRECPHCHGSLERYEDPEAVKIIGKLESELADAERLLDACESALRSYQYGNGSIELAVEVADKVRARAFKEYGNKE